MKSAKLMLTCCLVGMSLWGSTRGAQALVTDAAPQDVGFTGQRFSASSTYNVVARIHITTDGVGNSLQALYMSNDSPSAAVEGVGKDIVPGSTRLWYVPVDSGSFSTSTATYIGAMTYWDYGWWENIAIDHWVENNSAIYVTVDINPFPQENATCAFYFDSGTIEFRGAGIFPAVKSPATPPVIYLTSYKEPTQLQASHTHLGQPSVSTGQSFLALEFVLDNLDTGQTGPVYLQGLSITVKDASGTILAPSAALDSIGVRDSITDSLLSFVTAIPTTPGPVFLPLATTVTATTDRRLKLFGVVTSNTATAAAQFRLGWESPTDLDALYLYTRKVIPTTAASGDAFPLQTDLYSVQQTATDLQVYHTPSMPEGTAILRGQTQVNPLNFTFINPGNSATSRIDITHLTLTVTNGSGTTIPASSVFSRVAIGGALLYGETTSPPASSTLTIALNRSSIFVPAYVPVTASVQVDILPTASAVDFRLILAGPPAVIAQDANNLQTVAVSAAYASDPFPMESNTILLASSLQVSGRSAGPTTLYAGQTAACLELTFLHPGPDDLGDLALRGVTLTALDQQQLPLDWAQAAQTIYVDTAQGARLATLTPPATGNALFVPLAGLTIAPAASLILRISILVPAAPTITSLRLGVASSAAIDVFQPASPNRPVAIAGAFPLLSQAAAVGGGEGGLRLSNYPNPFAAGRESTAIAYFLLSPANVTATVYTLAGDHVLSLRQGELQMPGEQVLLWDGRTSSGAVVKNGVYLLHLKVLPADADENIIQTRKIAVIK